MTMKVTHWPKTAVLLIILIILATPAALLAHGGGTIQLDAVPVGPYELSIWTSPDPLKAGETAHITAFLFDESIGDAVDGIVLGADITVTFIPPDGQGDPIVVSASHSDADLKYLYEAEALLPVKGEWEIVVNANGPKGGGEASFTIPVESAGGINWTLVGGIAIAVVVIGWLVWQQRQSKVEG